MPFIHDQDTTPSIVSNETITKHWMIDLFPALTNGTQRWWTGRLTVDSVVIPIRSFSYQQGEQSDTLNVQLARMSDRTAFDRDASIKFEIGEKVSGSWVYTTMLDTAELSASEYQLANNGIIPDDSFSITARPLLWKRLDTTPLGNVILYDPAKLTVDEDDIESIPDIDGDLNAPTVTPQADFSLYSLLTYVADACGFAGYQTNIPDFPLRRVDFNGGQPYWSAVAGIIGVFEPQLSLDASDNLVIREGTSDYQPDTGAALELTTSNLVTISLSSDVQRYKGCLVTYQEQGLDYDYSTIEIVQSSRYKKNIAGNYPLTRQETWLQRYFRNSNPNTPVRTLRRVDRKWVEMEFGERLASSAETLNYNTYGLLTGREKRTCAKAQSPQAWSTFSAGVVKDIGVFDAGETAYSSASDDTWAYDFVLNRAEREQYVYNAHPYESDSVYPAHFETEARGVITKDSDEQQLGQDFDQPLMTAQRSGNLKEGLGSYWGTTDFRWEKQTPLRNGQVLIRTSTEDALNAESGEALLPQDYEDVRTGDIGISVIKAIQKETYVFDGGDSGATRILPLNVGEIPLSIARPLATRINRRQYYPATVQFSVAGLATHLTKGRAVEPKDRAGTSFGIFRVLSVAMEGSEGQYTSTVTARQIGDASVTAEPATLNDSFSVTLESGEDRTFTFDVNCLTGQKITGHAVADVAVELKRTADGSWTNIETTEYDVDSYAGTTQEFQLRITAGTITSPLTRSFTLTIGPDNPAPSYLPVLNDDDDLVYNDDNNPVYVLE